MSIAVVPNRLCPSCSAADPVEPQAQLWPPGWRCGRCGHVVPVQDDVPILAPELVGSTESFDAAFFPKLASLEATHFWFVARNKLIVGLVDRFFSSASKFLEIGCGNGAVLTALAGARRWQRLVGSDLHPSAFTTARSRAPNAEFIQLDATRILAENVFDVVGAFDVLEHIVDDEAVVRGVRRAVVPGGGVVIAVPQHPWLWSEEDEIAHHVRRYRRGELETKLEHCGFEVLFSASFVSLLLPLMVANRMFHRPCGKDAELGHGLEIGPTANRILSSVLLAEVSLTLAGLRWPLGGSRVVVARAAD